MDEVREATRRVMPRVDDLVRTMYASHHYEGGRGKGAAPLAPLLEARAAALSMALNSLSTVFKVAYPRAVVTVWLKESLEEMEGHLEALRLASDHEEHAEREKVEMLCPSSQTDQIPEEPEPHVFSDRGLSVNSEHITTLLSPSRRQQAEENEERRKDVTRVC